MSDVGMQKNISSNKNFREGQIIIQEGNNDSDEMYFLLKGSVDIYRNYKEPDEVIIYSLSSGSFFGEISFFMQEFQLKTDYGKSCTIWQ